MLANLIFAPYLLLLPLTPGQGISDQGPGRCNLATVYHLTAGGFLTVRSGPSIKSSKIDQLPEGHVVYICDEQEQWFKIFYSGPKGTCGTASPNGMDARDVRACSSGWVDRKWVNVLSG